MRKAFEITSSGILGEVISLKEGRPAPRGFTFTGPTDFNENKRYHWTGSKWEEIPDSVYMEFVEGERARELQALKDQKLAKLDDAWKEAEAKSVYPSSMGFNVDATSGSSTSIERLITLMESTESTETIFCDADNEFHKLSLEQVKTIRLEILAYLQALLQRKWTIRDQIQDAKLPVDLDEIQISFKNVVIDLNAKE